MTGVSTRLAALVLGLLLAAPASASAARFYGETAPGRYVVTAFTNDDGRAAGASATWRATCRDGVVRGITDFAPEPENTDAREFSAVEEGSGQDGDVSYRFEAAITGRRHADPRRPGLERFTGTLEATAWIYDDKTDQRIDTCRLKRVVWQAWREGYGDGRWTMAGDPEEYVSGGQSYAYDRTNATISAYGNDREVTFSLLQPDGTTWNAVFIAPKGQALRAGARFTGALEHPWQGDAAGLRVSGQARSCGEPSGEFTVKEARFDRRGRVRAMTIDFVQVCGGRALRGTVSFRSRVR